MKICFVFAWCFFLICARAAADMTQSSSEDRRRVARQSETDEEWVLEAELLEKEFEAIAANTGETATKVGTVVSAASSIQSLIHKLRRRIDHTRIHLSFECNAGDVPFMLGVIDQEVADLKDAILDTTFQEKLLEQIFEMYETLSTKLTNIENLLGFK